MIQKRILVVDDVPDWRAMMAGLLSEEGYHVKTAGSSSEALRLLVRERFHVAVLDVRLDETDEGNTEGLNLMLRTRDIDPSMAIIILTGYPTLDMVTEALRPDETGISPAFDFVEKDKISQDLLPGIKRALQSVVRINDDLAIQDEEGFFSQAARRLRFAETREPPDADLRQEIEELFRKLFFDCQEIAVYPVSQGYSGTAVVKVKPHYRDRGPGEAVIAKCGERSAVEREVNAYDTHVKGVVGGHRLPQKLDVARTRSLGGIIYSFAGIPFGEVRDFATLYQEGSLSEVEKVIENLFRETCFPWSREECSRKKFFYLTDYYRSLLGLEQTALERAFKEMLESKQNTCFELADGLRETISFIDQGVSLPNPVWFVGKHPLFCPTHVCTVHGDLNGWNVLVDKHGDVWLIDFGKCGEGHILQDFTALESFVKFSLVSTDNLSALYEWERGLLTSDFHVNPSLVNSFGIEELDKAFTTVCKIRQLAYKALGEHDMTEYYIGLLFHALKLLTILGLPRKTSEHALISAALICERLGETQGSEFLNAQEISTEQLGRGNCRSNSMDGG
jgi:CheY-like chemotaxis protein